MLRPAQEKGRQGRAAAFRKTQTTQQHAQSITINPAERLLSVIQSAGFRPRRMGKGWRSRCPACQVRSEALSISEAPNGAVLLHCFAGCESATVVAALGLSLSDLFPEPLRPTTPKERAQARAWALQSRVRAAAALLYGEATIVALAASDVAGGGPLSDEDRERVILAAQRAEHVRAEMGGAR